MNTNVQILFQACNDVKSPWNSYGTGILYMGIPFPVFYVETESEISKMKTYSKI